MARHAGRCGSHGTPDCLSALPAQKQRRVGRETIQKSISVKKVKRFSWATLPWVRASLVFPMSAELPTLFSEATSGEKRIRANGIRQLSFLLERASGDIGRLIGESARSSGRMGSICDTLVWELEAAERDADQVQRLLLILGKLACDDVDSEAQATRYSLRGRKLEAWLVRCVADDAALRTRYLAAAALQDMCSDHVLASAAVDAGAVAALQQAVRKSAAAAASARRGDDAELMYRFAACALNAILRARPHKTSLADRPSRTSPPPVDTSAKTMSVADHGAGTELSRNTPHVTPSRTASRSEDSLPAVSCSPRPAMPPSRGSSSRPMSGSASLPSLPMADRPRSGLAGGRPVHQQMAFRASDLHCASRPASPPQSSGSLAAADCGPLCSTSAGSGVSNPLSRSPSRKPSASRQGRPGQPATVCPQLSYDEMVELLELAVTAGDESLIAEALATAARAGIDLDQLEADLELKQSFIFSPRPPTSDAEQHRRAADRAAVEPDEKKAARVRQHAEDKAIVDAAEAAPAVAAAAAAGAKAETVVLPGATNPEEAAMETAEAMAAAAAAAKAAADEVRRAAFARAAQAVQASVRKVQAARAADVARAARAQEKARQEAIEHDPAPSLADGIVSTMLQKLGAEADATACELAESMVQGIIARALGRSFMSLAEATREALRAAAAEPLPAADDITTVVQAKEIAGALQAQSTAQAAEMAALQAALESLRGQHPAVYPGLHRPGLRSLDDLWGNASNPGSPEEHDELGQTDFSYEAALARMAERHAREAAIRVRKSAKQIQEKIHRARAHLHKLHSLNQEQERDREREMRRWERQMATYCLSETLDQARERVRALRANQLRLEEQIRSDAAERAKKLVKWRAERMSDAAALQAAKYRMELAELNRHAGDVHSQRASGLESRRKDALKSASTHLESKLQDQAQAQRQINAICRVRLPPLQVPTIEERLTAALGKGLNLETHAGGLPLEEREARRPGLAKAIRQLTLSPDAGRGSTGPRKRVFCAPPQPTMYRDAVMRSSKSVGALPALKQLGQRPRHAQRAPERSPPKASTMPASPQEGEMANGQGDNNDEVIPLYLTEPGGLDMLFGCHTLVKQPPSAGGCTSRSEAVDRHGRRRDSV